MGFLDFIRRVFGSDDVFRLKKVRERINELDKLKRKLDQDIVRLRRSVQVDGPKIELSPSRVNNFVVPVFTPRPMGHVKTMAEFLEEHIEQERQRIEKLREEVVRMLTITQESLREDDIEGAEETLYQGSPLVKEINSDDLTNQFNSICEGIEDLKERIRTREIERQNIIAQREADEERQRQENLRLQQELEEQIRAQRLREARAYEEQIEREQREINNERTRLTGIVTQRKINPESYLNYLRLNRVQYLYHFTDELNLNSIRRYGGLFSWMYCEQHEIRIPNPGGDSQSRNLDRRYHLEDYVRLSFCTDHPMAYRKHQEGATLVLLKIKIDVAAFKETLFSDINAADSDHSHGGDFSDLQTINFAATRATHVSRDHPFFHAHQAECLVKTFVPIEYIVNIDNPQRMIFQS